MLSHTQVFPSATAVLIMLIVVSTPIHAAHAAQCQLDWIAPVTNTNDTPLTDLAGYRLYYRQASGNYAPSIDVGNQTTYLLSGLPEGQTYYFAVSAYDTSGNESVLSDEVSASTASPPPPVARFTATPTSGSAPLNVAFTDTCAGQITIWTWTFGDNGSSTQRHPHHTYASPGTYTVSLTVNGPGGASTTTGQGYITVNVPTTPPAGLVAAYSFNEGTGSIVTDTSGKGHHGAISGAQWTSSGRYRKALVFDGVDDWVTVADAPSLDLTTKMTLEEWVYPTALSGGSTNGWRTVILKQQSNQLVYALYANSDNNRPSGYIYTSSDRGVSGNAQLPLNTWRHLAATYDGAVLRLYVNGSMVGSRSLTGNITTSGSPLRIGGNSVWGEYFKGRIDQVDADTSRNPRQRGTTASGALTHLMEAGEVQVTPQWQRVECSEAFADPIVIANAMSADGGASTFISLRHVEPTGFEIRLQHENDAASASARAVAGFLVLERGTYTLADGSLAEAETVEVTWFGGSHTLPFNCPFNSIPVVTTAVTSGNAAELVSSHVQVVTKGGLSVNLHGDASASRASSPPTLSHIAWEPSAGTLRGIVFETNNALGIVRGQWHPVVFRGGFDTPPVVLAEVQGRLSGSPLTVRWEAKHTDGVEGAIDPPSRIEDEYDAPEVVGYIALR
jgi:PKD repeat protein